MAEIFANYEVNKAPRWPRLVRFTVGSVTLHLIIVAVVLYVPALREALNLANALANTKYVNGQYKTLDGEGVQIIRFANADGRFQYPPGYFSKEALAAGEAATLTSAALPPGEYPEAQIVELYKPEAEATPTPNSPGVKLAASPSPAQPATIANGNNAANANTAVSAADKEKAAQMQKEAEQKGVQAFPRMDTKVLTALLVKAKEQRDKGEINLDQPMAMEVEAELNPDGTFKRYRFIRAPQNERLQAFAEEFIKAFSSSKVLSVLKDVQTINLVATIDNKAVTAVATTQVESADRAATMANGYTLLIKAGQFLKKDGPEAALYRSVSVTSKDKQVIVNFKMARPEATDILSKQVAAKPAT